MTAPPALPVLDRYDVYDLAYLAGGPYAVVDTALVALAERGRVRVQFTGELYAVDVRRRSPVEAAVLDALGPRPRRSVGTLRWRLRADERIASIGDRLVADGHRLRIYVPYGEHWHAYSLRRLQENPKIAGYIASDTIGRVLRRNGS